jgi:hypothetical protein
MLCVRFDSSTTTSGQTRAISSSFEQRRPGSSVSATSRSAAFGGSETGSPAE